MIPVFKVFMSDAAAEAVGKVLNSGYIGQGAEVEKFEEEFAKLVGAPDVKPLTVNSCTSALDLALELLNVGLGDSVISTPMTCFATNSVIVNRGARIVWADVDKYSGLISPNSVRNLVDGTTKAIMAVDWGGRSCDYDTLKSFGVPVIQDAAHSLLTTYKGKPIAETGGDFVAWSFQAIKHLTTSDGGALLVPKPMYEEAKLLRWYGLDRTKGDSFRCSQNIWRSGFKYHMNDVCAAIGRANIPHMPRLVERHRENAAFYSNYLWEKLRDSAREVILPDQDPGSAWWLYTVLVKDRDAFVEHMKGCGVAASPVHARNDRHYAVHQFRSHEPLKGLDFFASHEVAIPVGWWLSKEDRQHVADSVAEYAHHVRPS